MLRALGLLFVASCGRIGFEANARAVDDAAPAAADAFACTSGFGPWGAESRVDELVTGGDDWGGQISADGLSYYYQSTGSGQNRFYVARRPDRAAKFGTPAPIDIDGTLRGDLSVTGDELEAFITRVTAPDCIEHAQRTSTDDAWPAPAALGALCAADVACPYVTPDGLTLYYEDVGAGQIVRSTRATRTADFMPGAPLANLTAGAGCPAASGDQRELYYEVGAPRSLYVATRTATDQAFSAPANLFGLNAYSNTDVSITADGLELFFASDRGGAGFDVYRVTRSCL